MLLIETGLFYLLIGVGVGVAAFLRDDAAQPASTTFRIAAACAFWPLYFPLLLATPDSATGAATTSVRAAAVSLPVDELSTALSQVEAELDAALNTLDGWASGALTSDGHRLEELRTAWRLQAERIRELDRLFSQSDQSVQSLSPVSSGNARARRSEQRRQENLRRLRALRDQMHADLIGTLAWVRELVTQIHLAKFTGAPASSAEELVSQIAAAVDGLSEVSMWSEDQMLIAR